MRKAPVWREAVNLANFTSTYENQVWPAVMFSQGGELPGAGSRPFETEGAIGRKSSAQQSCGTVFNTPNPHRIAPSREASNVDPKSIADALVVEHLATVRYVARRIHEGLPAHVELEDLISAGMMGLMDAAAKYKDDKNTQFKTYAQFRIRGAILDSLRCNDWSPRELRRKGRGVEEAIRATTQRLGRTATDVEVAAEMGITLKEYQTLLTDLKALEIGSLNVDRNEDSGEEEVAYVAAPADEDPLFRCLKAEMKQHLVDAIEGLPERERMVLTLYYYEELSMKEIAELLGVVESRVSQIRSSAVVRVRAAMGAFAKPTSKPGKVAKVAKGR